MPLLTFSTVCYQETCKQRGGDLLIKWDVSHFSPTATCIQLQASVWSLRSVSSEGQMGSSLLIPNLVSLMAAGSLVGAAALKCQSHILSLKNLIIFLYKGKWLLCTGTHFALVVPSTVFSSEGLIMPLKDQQTAVQGFGSSHWADSCFP